MSKTNEPNPPSRKDEDFPKTNTMPEGWVMDELMEVYNPGADEAKPAERAAASTAGQAADYVPATGGTNGKTHAAFQTPSSAAEESLFTHRLDPFPTPGEQHGMWL